MTPRRFDPAGVARRPWNAPEPDVIGLAVRDRRLRAAIESDVAVRRRIPRPEIRPVRRDPVVIPARAVRV